MKTTASLKIAMTAYACRSSSGSEPGAGFWWALTASRLADVWLITRPLDDVTRTELVSRGITPVEVGIKHSVRFPQLSYVLWLIRAQVVLNRLSKKQSFNLTHHVTYASDWLPSPSLPGVPHLWGPVGGSTFTPQSLRPHFPQSHHWKELLKRVVTFSVRPIIRQWAFRRATVVLAQSRDTAVNFSNHPRVVIRPNCVIDSMLTQLQSFPRPKRTTPSAALVGRVIPLKGGSLAIEAMADSRLSDWTLHFYGDGPDRPRLEELALRLGISDRVVFHGHVTRAKTIEGVSAASCVLAVSAHEGAPWSVAEALAVGTPVVTWSHGGPAELVAASGNGLVVEPGNDPVESLISGIQRFCCPSSTALDTRFTAENLLSDMAGWYGEYAR